MRTTRTLLWLLVAAVTLLTACTRAGTAPRAEAQPQAAPQMDPQAIADYYRGKTVTVVVAFGPGGGFDTIARLLAKHMPKHLPGNPTFVVENMEGAGSLIGANHLYNVAKPDGLTFGVFNELQLINQLTEAEGVQFDARKFSWLGSVQRVSSVCTIRADMPHKSAQDLTRRDLPQVVMGGTGPGATTDDLPKLMNALAGTNFRLVSGYRGTADIRLATESKEVDGMCWAWESVTSTAQQWLDQNFITVPIYTARERHPQILEKFPNAVRFEDLVTDDQGKRLVRAATAPSEVAKSFAAPPGVPATYLQALRQAFDATMKDPEHMADLAQARLEIAPRSGPEVEQIVNEILSLDQASARRLAELRK